MKNIRNAREFCFQFFFHLQLPIFQELKQQLQADGGEVELNNQINEFKQTTNSLLADNEQNFVETQVKSTLKHYAELEKLIEENLKNWKISRLSKVDHTTLLLAVNELKYTQTAPKKVIINEAIEISKKFGTKESSSFINGILDNIAKKEN
ncbi:MAG: transcription antitermination factor NusB [Bacteriovoracaceae bacterium]|jgi:N utilization substance protein B|nr:transcription antitermination factor NusB [Bacteriovoracaceae bacterium]